MKPRQFTLQVKRTPSGCAFIWDAVELQQFYENGKAKEQTLVLREVLPHDKNDAIALLKRFQGLPLSSDINTGVHLMQDVETFLNDLDGGKCLK